MIVKTFNPVPAGKESEHTSKPPRPYKNEIGDIIPLCQTQNGLYGVYINTVYVRASDGSAPFKALHIQNIPNMLNASIGYFFTELKIFLSHAKKPPFRTAFF